MGDWGKVIAAASTSVLGIFALIILVVSAIATAFFRQAQMGVRLAVFLLIFGAACAYGYTIVNTGRSQATTSVVGALSTTAVGAGATHDTCQVVADSSTRLLGSADLAGLDKSSLKIARNEIYARHGFAFKTKDMQDHFAKCPWYARTTAPVVLSPTEAANVETIRKAEAS
jgi:hypothetical protein